MTENPRFFDSDDPDVAVDEIGEVSCTDCGCMVRVRLQVVLRREDGEINDMHVRVASTL